MTDTPRSGARGSQGSGRLRRRPSAALCVSLLGFDVEMLATAVLSSPKKNKARGRTNACRVGVCPDGTTKYTKVIHKYFLAQGRNDAEEEDGEKNDEGEDEDGMKEDGDGIAAEDGEDEDEEGDTSPEWPAVWRHEKFDLSKVTHLKHLKAHVVPAVSESASKRLPNTKARERDRWEAVPTGGKAKGKPGNKNRKARKTVFGFPFYGSDSLSVPAGWMVEQLPPDDSARVIGFTAPFVKNVACYKAGRTVLEDDSAPCAAKAVQKAVKNIADKGETASLADFQKLRELCLFSDKYFDGGVVGRSQQKCDYVEEELNYFNRDNRELDDSIPSAAVGLGWGDGKRSEPWDAKYDMDRNRFFAGMDSLPGAQYCLGPRDRMSKDRNTRYCACGGDVELPPGLEDALSEDEFKEVAGARAEDIPRLTWDGQWKSMSEQERDDYLMLRSYRELGVNWWGPGEKVTFRDFNPCPATFGEGVGVTAASKSTADTEGKGRSGKKPKAMKEETKRMHKLEAWAKRLKTRVDTHDAYSFIQTTPKMKRSPAPPKATRSQKKKAANAKSAPKAGSKRAASGKRTPKGSPAPQRATRGQKATAADAKSRPKASAKGNKGSASGKVPKGFEKFYETRLELPGKADQGDWTKAVYEYYGPLVTKIVEMDHNNDLSQVAFYGSSEGGAMMFELPLYLMHQRILAELKRHAKRGVRTVEQLVQKVLTTAEKRRPFCVGGVWGAAVFARPESIQGRANAKRLRETAQVCGDMTTWSSGLHTMDQHKYLSVSETVFDPRLVLHQLSKIAAAGYRTVEVWELPADHAGNAVFWSLPPARRAQLAVKLDGEAECDAESTRYNGLHPFKDTAELRRADVVALALPHLLDAEMNSCFLHHDSVEWPSPAVKRQKSPEAQKLCLSDGENSAGWSQPVGEGPAVGDLDQTVGAYAIYGRAFGEKPAASITTMATPAAEAEGPATEHWRKWWSPFQRMMYLEKPLYYVSSIRESDWVDERTGRMNPFAFSGWKLKTLYEVAGEEHVRKKPGSTFGFGVTRWVCRSFGSFRLCARGDTYSDEANRIGLRVAIPNPGPYDKFFFHAETVIIKRGGGRELAEEWKEWDNLMEKSEPGISKARAQTLFGGDTMCEHALPDPATWEY
eukprot:g7259.t1